ncbi:NADPH oxidase activator 1 [Paroedura picta]|uniref:NADPH oxidase activator 1 n=1 Tax=Paroedura picta TaxID=143630 RepID=UPI004055D640
MAYRDLVRNWHKGILAVEEGDWALALKIFQSIERPTSKIAFNIGCIHLLKGDLAEALEAFDQTVSKDKCLAVGFYQRGYVCLLLERYEEALNNCQLALTHLRNNSFIDYKQLGLKFVLCAWEVLYNTAAVYCQLGKWQDAERTLEEAVGWTPKGQSIRLTPALEQVQDHLFLEPRSLPRGEFFRPRKEDVEELEAKDFLGQPKVISSAFEEDNASTFQSLQSQEIHRGIPLPPEKVPPSRPPNQSKMESPGLMERNVGMNGAGPKADLQGKDSSIDRRILYQMTARYCYFAQGQEDLNFKEGDILEILAEVNEEWLEGRCRGNVGIFPKCFAVRENTAATVPPAPSPGALASPSGD